MLFPFVRSLSPPHSKNTQPTSFRSHSTKHQSRFAVWSRCVRAFSAQILRDRLALAENCTAKFSLSQLCVLSRTFVVVVRNCEERSLACSTSQFTNFVNGKAKTTLVTSNRRKKFWSRLVRGFVHAARSVYLVC